MHTLTIVFIMVFMACAEQRLGYAKHIKKHRLSHGENWNQKKPANDGKGHRKQIQGAEKKQNFHKKLLKVKTRRKGHLKMDMKKVDEILAIKNNNEFTRKVFQMMKNDDSDVLKDIDEDEEPIIFVHSAKHLKGRSRSATRKMQNKNSSKHKLLETFKRNFILPPPLNATTPNIGYEHLNNAAMLPSLASPQSPQALQSPQSAYVPPSYESTLPQQQSMQSSSHSASEQAGLSYSTLHPKEPKQDEAERIEAKASRVCKPGPPLASNKRLPNCLLIGDSITLGSSYAVAAALQTRCTVQMSPFSKAGCALDSRYGLKCIQFFLSTTNLSPTRYDVIMFNFGMHDINFSDKFPEEFNDPKSYARNLGRIKKILLKTGAAVTFATTTPVPFNVTKNDMVVEYNEIAERVMSKTPKIDTIDLYDIVIDNCGKVPYENCFMMKKPHDVHYGLKGSILLGKQIAAKIAELLKEQNLWVKSGYSLPEDEILAKPLFTDLKDGSIKCSANATVPTRCPSETTCVKNEISRSGYACCLLENGVDCKDNFHCCPENTVCHKQCSPSWCACVLK